MVLALDGCIPRGSTDYRIGSAGDTQAEEPAPTSAPQIVPESQVMAETADWSPAVVQNNARAVDGSSYIVKAGDTLYRIEAATGAGFDQIATANGLTPPYALQVGQRLTIPAGLYHRVGSNETGIAIARKYGVSWADIVALNGLQYPYLLRIGQQLRLPDQASVQPNNSDQSPEQRAAAFSLNIDDIVTGGEPALASAAQPNAFPSATMNGPIAQPTGFTGNFNWPLAGSLVSAYGSKGGGKINDGLDIGAAKGTAVRAAGGGIVVYSGNEIGVYGGLVLIDHGAGWITAYGHLGQLNVKRGDHVRGGQTIGTVGDTGYVTQPELHFEIRKDRKPIDPMGKLPRS